MGNVHRSPESELPLSPTVFNILMALADDEAHGYGIMRAVEEFTAGTVKMGPGTLYGSLDRMLSAGLVKEVSEPMPDAKSRRRRYYRLTDFGLKVLQAEAERLRQMVETAREKGLLRPSRKAAV